MGFSYLASLVFALGASLLLMPLLVRFSTRLGLVDDPDGDSRKIHSRAMPRSGGLAIIAASVVAVLLVLEPTVQILTFLSAAAVVVLFGLLDDVITMSPRQKLAGQALAAAIAMSGGMVILDVPLIGEAPAWFTYPLTFIFVLGVINGVNFSDGMDGLAAGTTLMSLLLLFILAVESGQPNLAAISLAVSGAVLGFLRFNTHPAVIFMGDAGSQFLGFVVAWLAITLSQSVSAPVTTLMPLLILGLPVLDIVQLVPVRIYKQLPLGGPDKEHLHHQISKLGLLSYETVVILYGLQAVLLAAAYFLRFADDVVVMAFFVWFSVLLLGTGLLAHLQGWRFRSEDEVTSHRKRNRIFRFLGQAHTYTGWFFGGAIALILASSALVSDGVALFASVLGLLAGILAVLIHQLSGHSWVELLPRIASYSATGTLIYGLSVSVQEPAVNTMLDAGFAVLAILLAVAIRTTRREYFWLTTQDLLVVFFVILLAPQLPFSFGGGVDLGSLIFRTAVILYSCEYVLARGARARRRLLYVSAFSMGLLGVHLL